jgi:hypothetical protein
MPKQEIAVNANLTWGQSMKELNTSFEQHHVSASYVDAWLSTLDPAVYIEEHVRGCATRETPLRPHGLQSRQIGCYATSRVANNYCATIIYRRRWQHYSLPRSGLTPLAVRKGVKAGRASL